MVFALVLSFTGLKSAYAVPTLDSMAVDASEIAGATTNTCGDSCSDRFNKCADPCPYCYRSFFALYSVCQSTKPNSMEVPDTDTIEATPGDASAEEVGAPVEASAEAVSEPAMEAPSAEPAAEIAEAPAPMDMPEPATAEAPSFDPMNINMGNYGDGTTNAGTGTCQSKYGTDKAKCIADSACEWKVIKGILYDTEYCGPKFSK